MFKVGDYVLHQRTGHSGNVVGYGHEMVNGVYQPTIKVRVVDVSRMSAKFLEDLSSAWILAKKEYASNILEVSQSEALTTVLESEALSEV